MQEIRKAEALQLEKGGAAPIIGKLSRAVRSGDLSSWREGSVHRRILAAMVTVGTLTIGVKIVSMLKEMVIAHRFGVADGLDAYLVAFVLPSYIINLIGGSFNAAMIPTYIQVREQQGKDAAQRLFSSVIVWVTGVLTLITIALAVAAPYILPFVGSSFSSEKMALTRTLFLILIPTIVLSGIATTWSAVLNAGERFALAALTPVMTPISIMAFVYYSSVALQPYTLAIATVAGELLRCLLLAKGLRRQGISILPRWYGTNAALRQVRRQYLPMLAGGCLTYSTWPIDQSMAAVLGAGSVSVLNYGNKITSVILGVSSVALTTAILPQFSRLVAEEDWTTLRRILSMYIPIILLIIIPATAILIWFSRPLVSLLFERGAFTAEDARQVVLVQSLYMLQLPFFILVNLFIRLVASLKANHVLMWGAAINFIFNIALDYVLMQRLGVAGIALSTSLVYIVSLSYLSLMLSRLFRKERLSHSTANYRLSIASNDTFDH